MFPSGDLVKISLFLSLYYILSISIIYYIDADLSTLSLCSLHQEALNECLMNECTVYVPVCKTCGAGHGGGLSLPSGNLHVNPGSGSP